MERQDYDKRPHYFPGQYLLEDDFELEQNYHIDRQRRHNRLLHVSGIADGLIVQPESNLTVKISAGTAIGKNGQQIVWSDDMANAPVNLKEYNNEIANGNYILSIGYDEKLITLQEVTEGYTRWYEKPNFNLVHDNQPVPDDFIALAKLKIDGTTVTLDESDKNARQYSGLRLPSPDKINAPTLRSGGDRGSNLAVLNGGLSVQDSLSVTGNVGIGTTSPTEKLEISGGNLKVSGDIFATNATLTGNVGIGTTSSRVKLEVKGDKNDYTTAALNVIDSTSKSLLYVRNDGNVGIGTTTPGAKLHIIDSFQNASGRTLILGSTEDSNLRLGYDREYSWIQSHGGKPLAINSLGNNVGIGTTDPKQQLVVNSGKASIGYNDPQQTAALAVNGNVGIGTKTPTVKLEVSDGDFKVSGDISATNARLTGNVGIGTTSPTEKLEISGGKLLVRSKTANLNSSNFRLTDAEPVLTLVRDGIPGKSYSNTVDFRLSRYDSEIDVGHSRTQLDLFLTHNYGNFESKPAMTLRSDGNVGIGTTTPTAKLAISASNTHLQLRRENTETTGGKLLFLELYQDDPLVIVPEVYPSIRFQHRGRYSHRIETRMEGFFFKNGDPEDDALRNIYAKNVASCPETLQMIRGTVQQNGTVFAGTGFTAVSDNTGLYTITFSSPFLAEPTVVATQQYPNGNEFKLTNGDTRDNAVVVGVSTTKCLIKCGRADGTADNRRFHFIAIGSR